MSNAFLPRFKEVRAIFLEKFPGVFWPARPLKIGVHVELELALPELRQRDASSFLRLHTRCDAYLQASVAGAERVGFDGRADGLVTEEQAQSAQQALACRAEKQARRIAAREAEAKAAARKAAEAEGATRKAIAEKVAAKVTQAAQKPVARRLLLHRARPSRPLLPFPSSPRGRSGGQGRGRSRKCRRSW